MNRTTYVTGGIPTKRFHVGAGHMTGHGIPTGFAVIGPYLFFPNVENRDGGKGQFQNAAINGRLVKCEDVNAVMMEAGYIQPYLRPRETCLYVTTSMRRSWRKKGVTLETYERYAKVCQRQSWSATRANAISWKTPDETRRQCGVTLP